MGLESSQSNQKHWEAGKVDDFVGTSVNAGSIFSSRSWDELGRRLTLKSGDTGERRRPKC